jgi:hypothetical protein
MNIANVSEIYPLFDSVIVSQRFHGNEANVKGWFGAHQGNQTIQPFTAFGSQQTHVFFKDRTQGQAGAMYCNLESAETMDFAYRLYSVGIRFWGPVTGFEVLPHYSTTGGAPPPPWGAITLDDPVMIASCLSAWWKAAFPYQCGFRLKVEQDIIVEGPAMTFPPGHGFTGSGAAWSDPVTPENNVEPAAPGDALILQHPQMISIINQGVPKIGNRFNFVDSKGKPQPIEIPKGALVKAELELSEYAQYWLANQAGPLYYLFNRLCPREWDSDAASGVESPAYWFGTRYGVTVTLLGERLVQRRGQYFAPGWTENSEAAEE